MEQPDSLIFPSGNPPEIPTVPSTRSHVPCPTPSRCSTEAFDDFVLRQNHSKCPLGLSVQDNVFRRRSTHDRRVRRKWKRIGGGVHMLRGQAVQHRRRLAEQARRCQTEERAWRQCRTLEQAPRWNDLSAAEDAISEQCRGHAAVAPEQPARLNRTCPRNRMRPLLRWTCWYLAPEFLSSARVPLIRRPLPSVAAPISP